MKLKNAIILALLKYEPREVTHFHIKMKDLERIIEEARTKGK